MADINDKNVNTTEGGATEAPKKKKYATVIRPQNSASGSKPGQRSSSRKPVDRTQAPRKEAPAKVPVKKPVALAPEKPAAEKPDAASVFP